MESSKTDLDMDIGPRSPLRTVQVLHELAAAGGAVSLASLSNRLQLPKTSLFRLLRSLEHGGYVVSVNGVHQVGPEALKLGAAIVRNREFPNCARPAMEALSSRTGETIILGTMNANNQDVVYTEVIEASHPLRFSIKVGTASPLYSSASGLTLLAFMRKDALHRYLANIEFVKLAQKTISSQHALLGRLKEIRKAGYTISESGMFDGVFSIAAPVVDGSEQVIAGVSISTPTARGLEQKETFIKLVLQAAEDISRILGYAGTYPPQY
jgi:DNA-binding IclR family transcriptional regulator